MPKYKVNGKTYNIPDDKVAGFEQKYPNATVEYYNADKKYNIPIEKRDGFLKQYPDATTSAPQVEQMIIQQSAPQPTLADRAKPDVDSVAQEPTATAPIKEAKTDSIQPVQPIQSPKAKLVDNPDDYYPTLEQNTRNDVAQMTEEVDEALNEAKGASARKYTEHTEQAAKGGLWSAIQNAMVNTVGAVSPTDMQVQTQQQVWRGGQDRELAKDIDNLEAAEHALENARRTINEADINAKNGTFVEKAKSTFVGGAARGFGQKLFDVRTWDMGVSDFKDQSAINDALDAAENGTLTESQEALLNAKAQEMAVQAYFGSYVGRGYKAGSVTAESLPFMLEMCINPASTIGKSATSRLARYAINKYGKQAAKKVGAKVLRAGARVAGDVLGASAMTATTGSIRTAADAMERMSGGVAFDTDEQGHAVFDGRYETPEDVGTAIRKAFAATTIENYSEMLGSYFAPMLGVVGKGTRNVLDKITAGRVGQFLDDVAASDFAKALSAFEKRAQWSGNLSEFAEELAGGTLNAIIVGDQTFDSNPETGVFNRDNLIDTFLGVTLLGGSLSMLKTAGYGVEKYQQKRAVKRADVAATDAFGSVDEWDKIKTEVDAASNEELPVLLGNIISNPDVTDDQKTALMVYVGAKQREKGAVIGEQKRRENPDVPQEQVEIEQSFDNGAALETPQEKNDAQNMFEYQQQQMRQYFGLGEDGDVDAFLGDDPIAGLQRVAANDQEAGQVVLDYLNAKATVDGVFQRMSDDAEAKIAEADAIIASRTNRNNGMIQRVRLKNDKQAYVLSGDIVMTDDGDMVNVSKSSESLVVIDAITGKKEYTYPSNIAEVYQPVDAEAERQTLREQVIDEYSQKLADDMNGTLAFAPGDNYTLVDDQGTQHNVQIVADNGDGTVAVVEVMPDGVQQEAVMAKSTIQEMSDTHNQLRLGQYLQDKKAQEIAIAEQEAQAEQPEVVAEEQQQQPVSALSRIPTNEAGEQMFEQAPVQDTWAALVELNDGDSAEAIDTAQQMLDNAKKDLAKAQKQKPKVGTTVAEIQANKAEYKANVSALQTKADYWAQVVGFEAEQKRIADGLARAQRREQARQAAQILNKKGRYSKELSMLGDYIDFEDFVMRAIVSGGVKFKWNNAPNGTKGLGAHLGLKGSQSEMARRIWLLNNTEGEYPEAAAEGLVIAYNEEMGYENAARVDAMGALDIILGILGAYDSPKTLLKAIQERHNTEEYSEEEGQYLQSLAEAEAMGMTIEDWDAYQDMMQEITLPALAEVSNDELNTIFVELYQQQDERSRENAPIQQGVSEREGRVEGNADGNSILSGQQPDNTETSERGDEQSQQADVAGQQSSGDVPTQEVSRIRERDEKIKEVWNQLSVGQRYKNTQSGEVISVVENLNPGEEIFGFAKLRVEYSDGKTSDIPSAQFIIDIVNGDYELLNEQTEVPQQYTITPAQYTNKRGKVLDMHLVKFSDDLSKEQQKAAKQLAKENRGWWDKDKGGFMMRSEESAKELADTILNNAEAVSDVQPVSLEQMREVGSATNDVVETQPAPQSNEPKWKYELTVYENGRTILERSQIMPNGTPISDGHFEVKADSPRDMLGILSNPNNGLESALEQIGTRLNERADVFDFREKARTEGVNGFKIGDNIIYTENGKREKGTIHDFNDYGDHAPVLDLGAAPVLYVQAQWDQVEKDDVTHRQFVQIMDFFGKDLTNADGRVLRIVEVAGAEKMVRFHITETNGNREEFTMPYTSFVEILDSGQWKKPVAEAMTATETKPKTKKKASVKPKQVNVEGLLGELNRKGEAKLSDHIVEEQTNPSGNKLVTDERYEELKRKMRQKLLGQMNMGIDPEILAIGTEMAVYHIEKGARKFADYAKGMIADLGDVIRPYLKAFYNGARELPEVESEGFADEMTPYEEVRTFDVANFDKAAPNAMATAETTVKEQEVEQQAEVATEKIKNNRNKARKSAKKSVTSQQATEVGLFDSAGVEELMSPDLMWETRAKEMYSSALKEWRDTNNPFGFDQYLRTVLAKKYNASSYDQANSLRRGVNSFFNNEEINPKNGEKESNIVEAEVVTPTQREALHTQFADIVKNDMLNALEQGVKPYRSIVDIRKRAESAGIAVDPDGRTDILLQELVEDGLVRAARIVVESGKYGGKKSKTAYDAIVQLYDMQPTIAARSSNRIKMQQYSTPLPMAFVADMFAISPSTRKVLEPTAGNGMMVFAVPREKIYANELDETRIANLRDQGFASVTQQDAMLPFDGEYDAVIANPPFGDAPAKDYDGKSISGLDPQIVLNSLAVMQDNGKAAIIIGGNMEYATNGSIKNKKSFFTYLYDHYNVKGVIDMSGGLYAKQGTTFPTRMILIDGRRSEEERTQTAVYPPIKDNAIAKVETFEQLYETVVNLLSNKQKTNGTEILRSQAGRPMLVADNASGETDGNGYNRQSRSNDQAGRRTERRGGAGLEASSQDSQRSVLGERGSNDSNSPASRGTDTIGEPTNVGGGSEQRAVVDGTQRMVGVDVRRSDLRLTQETKKRELSEEKLPYRPHNTAFSLQSVAPAAMVEAMDNVLSQIEEKYGNIDEFVRKELGYDTIEDAHNALAAEQMDSVAMAIYQMKQGQAMIIGDQTGVGKGRQMAALIRWAVRRGEKPIFITQKADLFSDIYRDLVDIGSGDLVPFIFNSDGAMVDSQGNTVHKPLSSAGMAKVLASGELPNKYDFAVLTYSQVNTGDDISQKEADELAKKNGTRTKKSKSAKTGKATPKATFLRAIAADNYLFLDESHTAAGSSNTGAYLQSILRGAKAATFASATFAKRPDTMPLYAIRTAMSQAKVEPDKMIAIIEKGGVTLQEIMSRELTNAGQMVRRERDMSDVVTDWKTITDPKTVERARANYDRTITAFNAIIKFQEDYVKPMIESLDAELAIMAESAGVKKGTDKMGVENVPFASKTYNYTKQLMLALKVDAIADEVEAEINAGRHPVIALESTMESSIKDYAAGEVIPEPTFSASLLRGLDTVMQYTVKDEDGNERHAHFSPQQLGAAGEKAYYDLQEFIRDSTSDIFISPLDAIIERLHEKGYKVGELTGRNLYVERKDDGRVVVKRRTDKDKKRMQREFNNGELDVLILNKSASTGISLHASEKFSDQRQRTMIIAQPLSDINDYMQMIGRIDRTGQVHRGYYINLGLPVPAENRFLMMLSTKLKSLNANTTTSQDSESNDVEASDLLNKYGSQVVIEYLRDNPEVYEKMGAPLKDGKGEVKASDLDEYKPQEDDARKVTGYVALLNTKEQEEFYDDVVKRYTELIKYLNDTGSNDLKITVMPLRAKTIEKRVSSEGIDPNGNNPFARNSYVEQVEMDVLRKPMKAEEIRKTINQINGEHPENHIQNIVETIRKEDEERVAAEEKRYERAKAKAVEDIAKQADKINAQKKRTEEEKREAIDIYTDETNEKVEEKHRNNLDRIAKNQEQLLRRLRMFSVSSTYLVPDNLETQLFDFASPAIFCGYKTKEKKITASTTLAVFATLDGRRRIEVKLSQIDALLSINKMTNMNWDRARSTTLENWDSAIPTETRKLGYIMTGNILQAIADTQDEMGGYPGQLISYTDIDGNIHDGILMPDKWNASMLKTSGAPLIARLQQIKEFKPVTSHDGKVEIVGSKWANEYYLTVPKTKKDGAVYFENPTLLKSIYGGNFYPYHGKLRADISADRIEDVVKELTKLGVKVKEDTDDNIRFRSSDRAEVIANFDADFAELDSEYQQLDKNDEQAMAKWRAKKKRVVESYLNYMTDDLALPASVFVYDHNDKGSLDEAVRLIAEVVADKLGENVEELYLPDHKKDLDEFTDAIAAFTEVGRIINGRGMYNVGRAVDNNKPLSWFGAVVHENAHHLLKGKHTEQEFADIWNEAVENEAPIVSIIQEYYADETNATKGEEVVAFAVGGYAGSKHTHIFASYIKGDGEVSLDDIVKKLNKSLPLRNELVIEVLNDLRNEYQRREAEVNTDRENQEANREREAARQGQESGERSPRRDSQATGQPRRDLNAIATAAEELAKQLNTPIRIIGDVSEINDDDLNTRRRKRSYKGWYDVSTGEVVVVAPNATSVADVQRTVIHEVVAHNGLRELFGADFDTFLDNVYRNVDEPIRRAIANLAARKGWDFRVATEEYLASLAETTNFEEIEKQGWWQKVKDYFMDLLRKVGIKLAKPLTNDELRYILWRSYQMQKSKGAMAVAEDVDMQRKLGVGNFRTRQGSVNGNTAEDQQIIAEAQRNGTYLKAPNGKSTNLAPKQWVQVRTKAFKRWFGDWESNPDNASKIVDENGEPLVVWHGGSFAINDFTPNGTMHFGTKVAALQRVLDQNWGYGNWKVLRNADGTWGWKYTDPDAGEYEDEDYSRQSDKYFISPIEALEDATGSMFDYVVRPYFLNIRNEERVDDMQDDDGWDNAVSNAIEMGSDGLVYSNDYEDEGNDSFVAFYPTQIKSAEINSGEFDPTNPDIRFREGSGSFAKPNAGVARDIYNEKVRTPKTDTKRWDKEYWSVNTVHRLHEAYVDSMAGLKTLQEAILKETGNEIHSYEDAYKAENRMSSENKAQAEIYMRDFFQPLMDEVGKLSAKGATLDDIKMYLIAKHGLERNVIFSQRAAAERGEEWDGTIEDYSGLTDLTGEDKDFQAAAQHLVQDFEAGYDTKPLWDKINAATKESLRINYESGLMSKETYDKVRTMFAYYVPLRGWDRNVAADEYEYLTSNRPMLSPTLKTAKGRKSLADDPIATIGYMAESAIIQGNRNLMKQKFLNFVLNNPTSLATVSEQWYVRSGDEWVPSTPDIPADATADEVDAIVKAHEQKMEALGDDATKKRDGLKIGLHTTAREGQEHVIRVKRAGKEYCIYINGNPIAAQAINGLTNPNTDQNAFEEVAQGVKNLMARAFTSQNPAFIVTNLSRDVIWAGTAVAVKEDKAYAAQYTKNVTKILATFKLPVLLRKFQNGTLDMNNDIERYFAEFIRNGGETGFTQINTVEDYKRDIERMVKDAKGETSKLRKAWQATWGGIEFLNRSAEDITRFSVYMTSRQMGRDVARSVWDAKEITVNFNKKGRGTFGASMMNFAYIFFNASIQGLANFGRLMYHHPKKMTLALSTFASAGMIAPMFSILLSALLGDDDDNYWDLPEWVRRNNIVLFNPFSERGFFTIPLPHELRPFYGMGELFISVMMGKESVEDALGKAARGFADLLPIDVTGNGGNMAINLAPTVAQPVAQLIANTDYFGVPIYRRNDYNELDPDWTKAYKGTNPFLVESAKWLNEVTGGDNVVKGKADINPAIVEHLFESYLGGMGKTFNKTVTTFSMLFNKDAREWRNVPVLSSFYQVPNDRTSGSQVNREYFEARDEAKEIEHQFSGYKKQLRMGAMEYAEKLDELMKSPIFARYRLIKGYDKAITNLNAVLKLTDDPTNREKIETAIMELKAKMLAELETLDAQTDEDASK